MLFRSVFDYSCNWKFTIDYRYIKAAGETMVKAGVVGATITKRATAGAAGVDGAMNTKRDTDGVGVGTEKVRHTGESYRRNSQFSHHSCFSYPLRPSTEWGNLR